MTDQANATGANPPPPDATRLLAELIEAMKRDADLRTAQLQRLDALIELRGQTIAGDAARGDAAVRQDLERELGAEHERTQRTKWVTAVFGLIAVIIGAVLFFWIFQMVEDMNRMEDYMYNMGHSQNDDRVALETERKAVGVGYMHSMADNMQVMREDIGAMRQAMAHMDGNIGGMVTDIGRMSTDMGAMRIDVGTMSRDMTTMNATMGLLRHDTALLRLGVGSMSNDTRSMGAPFRAMDSVMPW
jgi:hypothetical protein